MLARMLLLCCAFGALLGLAASRPARALATPIREIRVSLFGQPCVLQGPLDERSLQLIHSLSPEQVYPPHGLPLSSEPTRRALDKVRAKTAVPAALDRYRERLGKRLDAQLALLTALETQRKTRKAGLIASAAKRYVPAKRLKDLQTLAKKVEAVQDPASERGREAVEQLFDAFSDAIEADPEEEFHRAIHRMNVQYTCSFEEQGADEDESAVD